MSGLGLVYEWDRHRTQREADRQNGAASGLMLGLCVVPLGSDILNQGSK